MPRLTRTQPAPRPGILHLGLGAFFRAHGALFIADAIQASGGDWGVIGASPQSPRIRDALAPQGYAYTAIEAGPQGDRARLVQVLHSVLVAPEDPAALLSAMADPAIRIVTLTVTEKGYCHDPATRRLNLAHPDIAHDLAHPLPRSAPGFLTRALALRRAKGLRPFTVLSCDNLSHNGALTRDAVLTLARALDPALADWIASEGRFPSTMVDRIVPATQDADLDRAQRLTGLHDAAPVIHEPFRQWVIEDDFVDAARPDLAAAGAQMVADVAPFELAKLRLLNGAHSAIAYLGLLAGHQTVAEATQDPAFIAYLHRFWAEVIPALTPAPGTDLAAYAASLLRRFQNPAIHHRTAQIAMDGSQKLPQRLLATLAERGPQPALCLALAAWMRCVAGLDDQGQPLALHDPLAQDLRRLADAAHSPQDLTAALLSLDRIFPPALAAQLLTPVTQASETLARLGARAALGTPP